MSYSVSMGPWVQNDFTDDRVREFIEAEQARVTAQLRVADPDNADATTQAMAEQRDRLVAAITGLVQAIGPEDGPLYVAISGHANADHVPTGDWAPEAVTLSISHTVSQPAVDPDA